MSSELALKVMDLDVLYGDFQALWKVSLEAKGSRIVSLIGTNGAGKSTLLNTISGLLCPASGHIEYFGRMISGLPAHEIVAMGISLVPEGRRVFPRLTVYENLMMGAYTPAARPNKDKMLKKIHDLFPLLKARQNQMANTLSGGEQQMLAVARAMMSEPRLILCDEISLGLAPVVIKDIYSRLNQINQEGVTILLVEQDVKRSLEAAHYAYIMLKGKIVLEGEPASFGEEEIQKAYFGI